jgi:murein L,D-transpeptidase YafK
LRHWGRLVFTGFWPICFAGGCGDFSGTNTARPVTEPVSTEVAANLPVADKPIEPLPEHTDFYREQLAVARVQQSKAAKDSLLRAEFNAKGLPWPAEKIFFRAFKMEAELELWAWHPSEKKYRYVKTWPFCNVTGDPGPKRREGDLQTPEGFYFIDWFIPWSHRYLALQINYPNASDRILSYKPAPGKEILIHGGCTTEGCIPITDDLMKEAYIVALEAYIRGQTEVPIHIFPLRMTDTNRKMLSEIFADKPELILFWNNIYPGYLYFEQSRQLPTIVVDKEGKYRFQS